MTSTVVITLDQLRRRQPGGIATYIRGLIRGLAEIRALGEFDNDVLGLLPRGLTSPRHIDVDIPVKHLAVSDRALSRAWAYRPIGVPRSASVIHATSMAGPFAGGTRSAVHSVLVHDVLWRDHPELSTARGVQYHEHRLKLITAKKDLRVLVTSPGLRDRLVSAGIDTTRIHVVTLGVSPASDVPVDEDLFTRLGLAGDIAPSGNFVLTVGTIQPRKNVERLIAAHALARSRDSELGPLVIVGARGWGDVDTTGALVLGELDQQSRDQLVARARVIAYVPIEEGWGLPAVEALAAGRPLVVSTRVPSVGATNLAHRVDPLDVDAIATGLLVAASSDDSDDARRQRRASVSHLNWAACARGHVAAWT